MCVIGFVGTASSDADKHCSRVTFLQISPLIYAARLPLSIPQRQLWKGSIPSSAPFVQKPEEKL